MCAAAAATNSKQQVSKTATAASALDIACFATTTNH
jgi:hypothetical protein